MDPDYSWMAGWHHWLNGHEFKWTPGVGDGQEGLACYDSGGCQELDMTEWLNWTEWVALLPNSILQKNKTKQIKQDKTKQMELY